MLNKVATKLTKTMLAYKIIAEDMFDIYVYGFELLLSFLFNTTIIIIAGILLGRILQTLLFLLIFVLLRSFTGGYHANTYGVCTTVTFMVYGGVLLLSELFVPSMLFYGVLAIVGVTLLLALAPIEHPNKKITEKKKRKYKHISLVLFLVFITVGALLCHADFQLNAVVFFTLTADLLLLFVKNRKKGENKHEVLRNHFG